MKPKIGFGINKVLDKEMTYQFIKASSSEVNFGSGIVKIHPKIKPAISEKNKHKMKKIINNYIDKYYETNNNKLHETINIFQAEWKKVDTQFFKIVKKIFGRYIFSNKNYTGFASIINCNPRFLKGKYFQVYYKSGKRFRFIAIHEMLHFIFYDYCLHKYPAIFKELNTEEGIFWDLAEIFNSIMHKDKEFIKMHGNIRKYYYPSHKKYIDDLRKVWYEDQNIDNWIMRSFNYLNKQN